MYKCKRCWSECWKHGKENGAQRYKCKKCGVTFTDRPPKYSNRDREKAIHMYLNNCGVRKTALFTGCSPGTILNWVRATASSIRQEPTHVENGDVIEMDEIFAQTDRRIATALKKNDAT